MNADDNEAFNRLDNILRCIDPVLNLTKPDSGETAIESLKQFYFDNYGVPGTSEFEEKIEEINRNGG